MSPAPPLVTASKLTVSISVAVESSSAFSVICWATVGRVTIRGTMRFMPEVGVARRRVLSMNGRRRLMTPMMLVQVGIRHDADVVAGDEVVERPHLHVGDALAREHPQDGLEPDRRDFGFSGLRRVAGDDDVGAVALLDLLDPLGEAVEPLGQLLVVAGEGTLDDRRVIRRFGPDDRGLLGLGHHGLLCCWCLVGPNELDRRLLPCRLPRR